MAQFRLLNCTTVGNSRQWYAGDLVDDAVEPATEVSALRAAGGQLWPLTAANSAEVTAAAAIAAEQRALGRPVVTLNGIMLGAAAVAARQ